MFERSAVPSDSVFAAHGLRNVTLDVPQIATNTAHAAAFDSSEPLDASEWIVGSARYQPVDQYPLLVPKDEERDVRFSFCPIGDLHLSRKFRRHAQLLAIDTSPNLPGPSKRFSRVNAVLAWWEDSHGLWLLAEENVIEEAKLIERWNEIVGESNEVAIVDRDEGVPIHTERRNNMSAEEGREAYGRLCQVLLQVVDCIKVIHSKHLSLISCRPACFSIPLDARQSARLTVMGVIVQLPEYNRSQLLDGTPVAESTLFRHDPPQDLPALIHPKTVRKHIRYQAPETVINKRISSTSVIYSFGVLVYELLTGTTIDGGPDSPEESEVDLLIDFHRHVTMSIPSPIEWLTREAELGDMTPVLPPKQLSDTVMRCLGKEPATRYISLDSLAYDLSQLARICQTRGNFDKFAAGRVDDLSRFRLPSAPVQRRSQLEQLHQCLQHLREETSPLSDICPVVNISGVSGSGKTTLARQFTLEVERSSSTDIVTVYAKLEETSQPPLTSFVQIFEGLLDRFLTDPRRDVQEWNAKIRRALGARFDLFVSLVSADYQIVLGAGEGSRRAHETDWPALKTSFATWAQDFLQTFARSDAPLIIVIDDIQWMPKDEADHWRAMTDGSSSLRSVLLISTSRISPRMRSTQLSASSINLSVEYLNEDAVTDFLEACFGQRLDACHTLASFLFAETDGSPLFLRTIVSALVKEGVIKFDYQSLVWSWDAVQLQKRLSQSGVDAYLERLISSLPTDVQEMLFFISCLPSRGFRIDQIGVLLAKSNDEIERLISFAAGEVNLLSVSSDAVSFAHDGPRAVTYRMIPAKRSGEFHRKVSDFLRSPFFNDDFIFEAAEHALKARELEQDPTDGQTFTELLLDACSHTAVVASFPKVEGFLRAIESIIEQTGGFTGWTKCPKRATYIRYLQIHASFAPVLNQTGLAFERLRQMSVVCETHAETYRIASSRVRLKIACAKFQDAVELTLDVLRKGDYDPLKADIGRYLPRTPDDVVAFEASLTPRPARDDDPRIGVMSLIGIAGSSLYYCEPELRTSCFNLGLALAMQVKSKHETTAYFLLTYALALRDLPMKRALTDLGRKLIHQLPVTYLIGHAYDAVALQAHYWLPWPELDADMQLAIETNVKAANFEQATNALVLDLGNRVFGSRPVSFDHLSKWYDVVRTWINGPSKYILELPLQCFERVTQYRRIKPWVLESSIITQEDTDKIRALPMHYGMRNTYALKLATVYDAPSEYIQEIISAGRQASAGVAGLIHGVEWVFLVALHTIQMNGDQRDIEAAFTELQGDSPDFAARAAVLRAMIGLKQEGGLPAWELADKTIDVLLADGHLCLAGILGHSTAKIVLAHAKSERLAAGFLRSAAQAYRQARMYGPVAMLRERHPSVCPPAPASVPLPPVIFGSNRTVVRAPHKTPWIAPSDDVSVASGQDIETPIASAVGSSEVDDTSLDFLALMRSSLALASEQDTSILLCTLVRTVCQFVRAEYAAIALADPIDPQVFKLRAAGPFSRIVPYDVSITEEACRHVCPTMVILQTARTGRTITSLAQSTHLRNDPFFEAKQPKTIISLPIMAQGKQAGVICLASFSTASAPGRWETTKEIVTTLATFAMIATNKVSFTKRLQSEVDQRTQELSNALAAKTQFLSQCSHELRSPLTAILGLAAVIEDSSGLSAVQREHLRTITSSGEDLLGLINNILDHSKLENGSVTLEHIPFTLRDVVEGALDSVAANAQKKNLELALINSHREDPPGMIGDPFRIKQILLNLVSNAIKFTDEGRITCKWTWKEFKGDRPLAEGDLRESKDKGSRKVEVIMDVEDTGIGIPSQKMDKLFRSFSQVDESITRSYGGSGLGLIISKDLAKMLGGDCTASSELGRGSKFTFKIIAACDAEHVSHISRFKEPKSGFVLCPAGPWWDMLEENLRAMNCQPVRFADSAEDCLVKAHAHGLNSKKQYDFVMPAAEMIDPEMLKRMKQLQPTATFIHLVRSIDLSNVIRDLDISREDIVSRPIKFASLQRAMLRTINPNIGMSGAEVPRSKKSVNKRLSKICPLDILLVDDNKVNITVGKRILEMFGYRCISTASDGQHAIEAAEKRKYDLIMMDLQMPRVDGYTAHKRIRASPLAGDPCVVALTANADRTTQQLCLDEEFFDYLSKPLDIRKLETILYKVYHHRRSLSQNINEPEEEEKSPSEDDHLVKNDQGPESTDKAVERVKTKPSHTSMSEA